MSERGQEIAEGLLRLSAQKLWAERANPISMPDRDLDRLLPNRRSPELALVPTASGRPSWNGRPTAATCRSPSFVATGSSAASITVAGMRPNAQRRHRRPRPLVRSLPLPLAS